MWAARCSASINPTPKNCVKRSIPDTANRTNNGAGAGAVSRDDAAALAVAGGNPKRCPRRSELATAWTGLAWTRGWLFSGFGWNGLGVALHATWPMIQMAEFTGVAGVTFFVAFSNSILTTTARRIWQETRTRVMRPHYDLTLTMVGLVGIFAFGVNAVQSRPATRPLHVALVQASVPRAEKFDLRYKQKIFEKFDRLSRIALTSTSNIELLVWPESAMPAPVLEDEQTFDFVTGLAASTGVDILLGVIDAPPEGGVYNAALLVRPEPPVQLYRKVHLVPFGEYVPLRHSFPLFAKIAGDQV